MLEQYAEQLERQFGQRKRSTLETIRAELQDPYEDLRREFEFMSTNEVFTMLTGETRDSLTENMIVPVSVKRTFADRIEVKLDCGIDGQITEMGFPEDVVSQRLEPRNVWAPHQTIQAKLMFLDRKKLSAGLSLKEEDLRKPYRRPQDHGMDEWDDELEERDRKEAKKIIDTGAGRAQRVIKHPLFRPFNSRQAEDFLAQQGRGDCVIRPSSKGPDHLAVTWKIHDGLYQHVDVLELDKENEFSVGKTLKIGGKYTYSDLDELIALHIKAMGNKVNEMMADDRYQADFSKQQTGKSAVSQQQLPLTNPTLHPLHLI
jgi:transcription elongation factor SPT6